MILATISLFLKGCFVFMCYAALAVVNPGGLVPDMEHTARQQLNQQHTQDQAPAHPNGPRPQPQSNSDQINSSSMQPVSTNETPVQQVNDQIKARPVVLPPVESVKQLPNINDYPPKVFNLQHVIKEQAQ